MVYCFEEIDSQANLVDIQIDPTFNQDAVDVTHILISRGDMNGSELLTASAELNAYAANMDIMVIEVRYD